MQGNTASFPVWFRPGEVSLSYGVALILQGEQPLPVLYGDTVAEMLPHDKLPAPWTHPNTPIILFLSFFFLIIIYYYT